MSNIIKLTLETAFKEYIEFKNYFEEQTKDLEKKRAEITEKVKDLNDFEKEAEVFFDLLGHLEPLNIDVSQMKNRLYHYIIAYKELIDIPKEILDEIGDYQVKYTFDVKNGKKEIVDQELYDFYKKRQLEISKYQAEQNQE
jgi:vacuolar-type H+-ATPase subunit I/STV1